MTDVHHFPDVTIEQRSPLPDPIGPVNEDFKRGACYIARVVSGAPMPGMVINIPIPGETITCTDGKP